VKVIKERNGVTIRINAPKSWFVLIVGPIWLTFWTIGGVAAANALIRGTQNSYFYVYWLFIWILSETYMLYIVLWTAFGIETITVRDGSFIHTRKVFGFGRRRTIPLHKLRAIRAMGPYPKLNSIHSTFRKGVMNGTVAIRLRPPRTYRIGMNLDKAAAKELVAELVPYLQRQKLNSIDSEKPTDA
jgi:hypothetical protein